jgi:hypothetical protein
LKSRSRQKKKPSGGSEPTPPLNPMRTGMPAQDSIVSVREMKREGKKFRIIKTTETDEYEDQPSKRRPKGQR